MTCMQLLSRAHVTVSVETAGASQVDVVLSDTEIPS